MTEEADICMICEGSYPYSSGGVAEWVQELIEEHKERTFHIISLVPLHSDLTMRYTFPSNVIGSTVYVVQQLPKGARESCTPKGFWDTVQRVIEGMIQSKTFDQFDPLIDVFREHEKILGRRILTESKESWDFFIGLYKEMIPTGPFKSYFATAFTLSRCLFSMLLPELPKAKIFHAVCTGYAGFLLCRAKRERKAPCLITEHGIYSNERRIEISMADWIPELTSLDLALEDKDLSFKDFWLNAFFSLAHACYKSCDEIICTFDGNQEIQIEGGADPKKMRTIVHGIKQEKFSTLERTGAKEAPIVALIGRVVPIKDIKTFIRSCKIVKEKIPKARFLILGPTEEDPHYFAECQDLAVFLHLQNEIEFLGKVDLDEFFPQIDLLVLTSISEAQPLVILESGAQGIPVVATNVGACSQLINGSTSEDPPLGHAGFVTPLVNPEATSSAILKLLTDPELYESCSKTILKRIATYYRAEEQSSQYRAIYDRHLQGK